MYMMVNYIKKIIILVLVLLVRGDIQMFLGGCQEAKLLSQLASELSEALGFASQGFEAMAVPWVALTDSSDPFGARKLLSWAAVFYVLAPLGSFYSL